MEFDTIDCGKGEPPEESRPHFQGEARLQRSAMTHLTVQVTEPGDIDWDVDEGDGATDDA